MAQKAGFDGIEFFVTKVTIRGGLRHAVHEFPHSAGGEIEKMGRKPYVIVMHAEMHNLPGSDLARNYPDLYPVRLTQLRNKFDQEITGPLIVPKLGSIQAVATSWAQNWEARIVSGETFELEFIEDQEAAILAEIAINPASVQAMTEANDELMAKALLAAYKLENDLSVIQKINDAVTAVQGAISQADVASRMLEAKLRAVEDLCSYADSTLESFQDPTNHLIVNALKDVWLSARELAENVVSLDATPIRTWTVPKEMNIAQISTKLFGTSEKGMEILQMNDIADSDAIPPGQVIKYLAA